MTALGLLLACGLVTVPGVTPSTATPTDSEAGGPSPDLSTEQPQLGLEMTLGHVYLTQEKLHVWSGDF